VDIEIEIVPKGNDIACEPLVVHVRAGDQVHIISHVGIPTAILRKEDNTAVTVQESPFDRDAWISTQVGVESNTATVKPGFANRRFLMVATLEIAGVKVAGTGKRGAIIIIDT
jgi:hypothetical protein